MRAMPSNVSTTHVIPQSSSPRLAVHVDVQDNESHTSKAIYQEPARASGSEWIDVDDEPKIKKRRKSRRSTTEESVKPKSTKRAPDTDVGRFLPRLSQILESSESKSDQSRRRNDTRSSSRYDRRDDNYPAPRRSHRARTNITSQRRQDQFNASLLSVLSGLTTSTDRSSGSNSTITQQSYSRHSGHHHRTRSTGEARSVMSAAYRVPYTVSEMDDNDDGSIASVSSRGSSVSAYTVSDTGSSDAIGTPSSRSTFPSPTQARGQHVADLRKKYDAAMSLLPQDQNRHRSRSTGDQQRRSDESASEPLFMHSSYPSVHPTTYDNHYMGEMHRSASSSSAERAAQTALQPYQYSDTNALSEHYATQHDLVMPDNNHPPAAPEAPDITRKTVAGYEMLALELSSSSSTVKPMYRKFEYLNHRLLLHLQDELVELEDQLRTVDEIIAQNEPSGKRSPQSRRQEQYYGVEIHHHRTGLLGRIFQKTEQYNKAMAAYSAMLRDCDQAKPDQVRAYQEWMAQHRPVHELESVFLWRENDLIVPGARAPQSGASSTFIMSHSLSLVAATMIVISILPTISARLTILAIIMILASAIIWTTRLRDLLSFREWAICLSAYLTLMLITACCLPQRT